MRDTTPLETDAAVISSFTRGPDVTLTEPLKIRYTRKIYPCAQLPCLLIPTSFSVLLLDTYRLSIAVLELNWKGYNDRGG